MLAESAYLGTDCNTERTVIINYAVLVFYCGVVTVLFSLELLMKIVNSAIASDNTTLIRRSRSENSCFRTRGIKRL